MARIAFFSPLPPNPSGISDYSAVILPALAARHDVHLYYDRQTPPLRALLPDLKRFPHDEFIWRAQQQPYDLNVYQMGNSLHHAYMHPFVFHHPGLLVLHDLVIHHARGHVLLKNGRQVEYRNELEYCHPGLGRQVGDILAFIPSDFTCYQFPMNKLMVDCSLAAATHTTFGVHEVQAASPGKPVLHIRHPRFTDVPLQPDLLCRYHLEDAWPVLASFGFITAQKRIEACLNATMMLRTRFPRIKYLLVGGHPKHFNPRRLVRKLGIEDVVTMTGRVEEEVFNSLYHAASIVLNLRYPSAREMSGTLLRALGAGCVTLVSEQLHLSDIPADIAVRVPLFDEADAIARIVEDLMADEMKFQDRRRRAREFIENHHRVEQSAADYFAAIDAALEARHRYERPGNVPVHIQPLSEWIRTSLPAGFPDGVIPRWL